MTPPLDAPAALGPAQRPRSVRFRRSLRKAVNSQRAKAAPARCEVVWKRSVRRPCSTAAQRMTFRIADDRLLRSASIGRTAALVALSRLLRSALYKGRAALAPQGCQLATRERRPRSLRVCLERSVRRLCPTTARHMTFRIADDRLLRAASIGRTAAFVAP
jgi:hypothetical protein